MKRAMNGLARKLAGCLKLFAKEQRGVAALEFAMLLPMMMTLFVGSVEMSTGVAIDRKVTIAAHTIADLASQFTTIADSDMTNILNASTDVIYPYPSANLQAVVSELSISAQGVATVVWSDTLNGTARTVGSTVTIPTNLAVPSTYLLLGETAYNYKPTYGYVVTGTMALSDQIYVRPRQSNSVTRN
jgi:Flp pilus assembly protein TadG